jgi:hypothetical protein
MGIASAAAVGFSSDQSLNNKTRLNPPTRAPDREARPAGREIADKALHDYYGPTAVPRITGEYDANGVKCFAAAVTRNGALADADVTAAGDLITMGVPEAISVLTPGAMETAQLFRTPVQAVTREDIHGYWVTVKSSTNRPFVIQFDAAGRIRDIKSSEQLREDAVLPKVGGPQARHLTELAQKRFSNMQVRDVLTAIHDPGYFMVSFQNADGRGWAIMNEQNDVVEWRFPEKFTDLPEPVRRAAERELHGDRVTAVEFGAARLFRIPQMVGGEEVTMLVKSDGAVDWISTRALHTHREQK